MNQYTYATPFTKEELGHAYHVLGMSQAEIAKEFGTSQKVVWRAMAKFGIARRIAAKRNQKGINNSSWKGSKACYTAFHARLYATKGKPKCCEVCGTTDQSRHYDWANLTGRYDDPNDYKRMCRSCHWKNDEKILNIKKMRGRSRKEA